MLKIEKYTGSKTYMFPCGEIATPEKVKEKFPACLAFTHIAETDESGQVLYALQNLEAVRSQFGIESSLSEVEKIKKIEEIRNTPAPEPEPDAMERVAAALEFNNILSM